jgi:hypothetical protein
MLRRKSIPVNQWDAFTITIHKLHLLFLHNYGILFTMTELCRDVHCCNRGMMMDFHHGVIKILRYDIRYVSANKCEY